MVPDELVARERGQPGRPAEREGREAEAGVDGGAAARRVQQGVSLAELLRVGNPGLKNRELLTRAGPAVHPLAIEGEVEPLGRHDLVHSIVGKPQARGADHAAERLQVGSAAGDIGVEPAHLVAQPELRIPARGITQVEGSTGLPDLVGKQSGVSTVEEILGPLVKEPARRREEAGP